MSQEPRYTNQELELISNTFSDNKPLLKAIRNHFLQNDIESDRVELKKLSTEALAVIRKTFLPEMDREAPIGQSVDMWSSINTRDQEPDLTYRHMQARKLVIQYMNQQLRQLEGEAAGGIALEVMAFSDDKTPEDAYVQMKARNDLIMHIEGNVLQLQVLAGQQPEDAETIKKRLAQNSNK